ncbi:hypothetical protein [Streptomyces sp. NPDC053367]|uniref:hypothetical protein n=1 Tax=Streptomyces sp. NPDC053367 TaxID=3365700 RepID=UPI0037CD72BD
MRRASRLWARETLSAQRRPDRSSRRLADAQFRRECLGRRLLAGDAPQRQGDRAAAPFVEVPVDQVVGDVLPFDGCAAGLTPVVLKTWSTTDSGAEVACSRELRRRPRRLPRSLR